LTLPDAVLDTAFNVELSHKRDRGYGHVHVLRMRIRSRGT